MHLVDILFLSAIAYFGDYPDRNFLNESLSYFENTLLSRQRKLLPDTRFLDILQAHISLNL